MTTRNGDIRHHPIRALSGLSHISQVVDDLERQDAREARKEEQLDNAIPTNSGTSSSTENEEPSVTVISWEPNDPENPHNWSNRKKKWIVFLTVIVITNSTMGSALPSMAIPYITAEWGITSSTQKVLPMSVYLIGYVMGPLVWAPLSEQYGRRLLTLSAFVLFLLATMSTALAPSWASFLIFRLLSGTFASAPMAVAAGIFADIFPSPRERGRSMALFMVVTLAGPLFAPIISGFCSPSIGWRWTFWIGTMVAGVTAIPLCTLPETNAAVLLTRRAKKLRKADPEKQVFAAHEMEGMDLKMLMTRVLTRPVRMVISEQIVRNVCAYLALVYAIFYMSFQAYPIIFMGVYHMSPGVTGLTYLWIGAGAFLCLPPFYWWDGYLPKLYARYPWMEQEEYRRLPIGCVGGPLFAISLFWLGWTAREGIHWAVPMMAGLLFGCGFQLIFMALINYLTDSYGVFAASANAAASCSRSILAVVLPLATTPLFNRLGIAGACSLLAGLSLLMSVIPFLFIWKGVDIRQNSKFCIYLREQAEEAEKKAEEEKQKTLGSGNSGSGLFGGVPEPPNENV